jgi:hypothetical protein
LGCQDARVIFFALTFFFPLSQASLMRDGLGEEALRQLKVVLSRCYQVAFENRHNVADTTLPLDLQNRLKKIISNLSVSIG